MIDSCSHWITAFPGGHQSLPCLCHHRYKIKKPRGNQGQQQRSSALPCALKSLPFSSAPALPLPRWAARWAACCKAPAGLCQPTPARKEKLFPYKKKENSSCWRVRWRSREQKGRRGEQKLYFINVSVQFSSRKLKPRSWLQLYVSIAVVVIGNFSHTFWPT